jgi:hypothetical protein
MRAAIDDGYNENRATKGLATFGAPGRHNWNFSDVICARHRIVSLEDKVFSLHRAATRNAARRPWRPLLFTAARIIPI